MNIRRLLPAFPVAALTLLLSAGPAGASVQEAAQHAEVGLGAVLPLWSVIPFVGILLSIALFPLLAPHWWHQHFPKISAFWALLLAIPFVLAYRGDGLSEILHIYIVDYIPFIILLWALFTIAGGVLVEGTLAGTPGVNTALLLIGTALASWIGTTGAAMVMIRPVLRANAWRRNKVHIIAFFIFLVANVGGSLTPLGDPPLFLGFLHHVPFFWTFHLFPQMGLVVAILIAIFVFLDTRSYKKELAEGRQPTFEGPKEPLRIRGAFNFLLLAGVVGSVLMSGMWRPGEVNILGVHQGIQNLLRDALLIGLGLLSLKLTPWALREKNGFTWFPILEVAYLFAGIFMTIVPALAILKAGEEGALGPILHNINHPYQFFWVTGILSSFLDNAPTYLTFFNSALGHYYPGMAEASAVEMLISEHQIILVAIASGAVFMGANTYIGNAPNFMVKSIAEENGIPMPSFFGYIVRYTLLILLPVWAAVTVVFYLL
jgi:Na+/H+ antiporter NhaD/arsenite permease-like protein